MKVNVITEDQTPLEVAEANILLSLDGIKKARKVAAVAICDNIARIGRQLDVARGELVEDIEFGKWCKDRFGWSRSYTLRMRDAGRAASALLDRGVAKKEKFGNTSFNSFPSSESQLRVLADYSDDDCQVREAWSTIEPTLPRNGEGEIKSAAAITKALAEHKFIDPPTKKEPAKKVAKNQKDFDPMSVLPGLTKKQALALAKAAQAYAESL